MGLLMLSVAEAAQKKKKNPIHHINPSWKIQQYNNFIFLFVQNLTKSSEQLQKFNKFTYIIEKLNTICSGLDWDHWKM